MKEKEDEITFNKKYYDSIIKEFSYNPLEFERINFSLGKLNRKDLQMRWLCHHGGKVFAKKLKEGKKSIVTTGFGMSGVPHAGTLSEILKAITLQRAGISVQIVIGDLDAYNGKSKPLAETILLANKYKKFILALGFKQTRGSILRSQYDQLEVLRTSYIIGHYMNEKMFEDSEEELHSFYHKRGKVDLEMTYRRKLSLNLMIADFVHLSLYQNYTNVMVMLGIDEHKYVRFGQKTIENMKKDLTLKGFNLNLAAIYASLNRGFNGYPKMSKSFPDSSIRVDMQAGEIRSRIINEPRANIPENDLVYQLMASASYYTPQQLKEKYLAFLKGGEVWGIAKKNYAEMLVKICSKWKN